MEEIRVHGYYSNLYDNNFVSTNMCCRYGMEFFLSQLLFKNDLKRVLYSKEDIAFRRRVETVGQGDVKDGKYNYVNLDLPYAVYSQTGSYEEDDRGSTQNVGQMVLGQVQPDSGIILKAAAVKVKYNSTIFFARREDVNVASQLLYWEKSPKFPVYFIVEHELFGHPIDIPVFITLDSFDSNVDYTEKEWLEKSKIFPIKCEFTIRSYQTLIESIDDGIKLPLRFSGLYGYNTDEKIVYTQKTSLIWANNKWEGTEIDEKQTDSMGNIIHLPQDVKVGQPRAIPQPNLSEISDHPDIRFTKESLLLENDVNETIVDAINGYFEEERDCILEEYHQVEDETTENSVLIKWIINENNINNFDSLVIYIPGITRTKISDLNINTFEINHLYPGSEYDCTIIIYSKNLTKLTYKLTLKTKGEKVLGKKLSDNLIGKTFQIPFTGNNS